MRCADAAEKVTALHPEYLEPYKTLLLETVVAVDQPEVRWHVAPMLTRVFLSEAEQKQVFEILTGYLSDKSRIVKTFAMQALSDLAKCNEAFRPSVIGLIRETVNSGTPAMKARARKLLSEWGG